MMTKEEHIKHWLKSADEGMNILFVDHVAEIGKMVVLRTLMRAIYDHFVDINKMVWLILIDTNSDHFVGINKMIGTDGMKREVIIVRN